MNKQLLIVGILLVIFVALNAVPLPRGPIFECGPGTANSGPHAQLFGFPFTYLQRSVSPSACGFADGQATEAQSDYYATHHLQPLKAVVNAVVGLVMGAGLYQLLRDKTKRTA